jgi:magnesium transporter
MLTALVYRNNKLAAHNPPAETLAGLRDEPGVMLWVDLTDPTEAEIKLVMEELFALHPLVIEDCTTDSPFPKLEAYDEYLYLVMHAVDYSKTDKFSTTELDLILGKRFLLTFHRQPLRPVQSALDRSLRNPNQPVRGPDRFAHTILDAMVEAYQPALNELRAELEEIETAALQQTSARELFPRVLALRKELAQLRQIVRPQRAVAIELAMGRTRFIRAVLVPYLRDLGDELARIEGQASGWADQLILSFRVYLNRSNFEASEGIRVLTALTALSIPPLLIGGWFGMNFARMPELERVWAYPLTFGVMLLVTGGMATLMRVKRWL